MGRGTSARVPFSAGGRDIVIAIDDEGFDQIASRLREVLKEFPQPYVVVRASELNDPDTHSDFWLGRNAPTAPGRALLWITEAFERYEQSPNGLIFCDGEVVWPSPPTAFGNPRTREEGQLRLVHEAALFFSSPERDRARTRMIGRLLQFNQPPRISPGFVAEGWLDLAHERMKPFGRDLAAALELLDD